MLRIIYFCLRKLLIFLFIFVNTYIHLQTRIISKISTLKRSQGAAMMTAARAEKAEGGVSRGNTLQHTATHCNTLQHPATLYSTLQCAVTHCNTLL